MAATTSFLNHKMSENHNNATDDTKPTFLHDFLGRACAPATAADVAGSSSPSPAAARGGAVHISAASDLGSAERQTGTLLEGVPFFTQKPDFSGSKIRYSGSKRSNSDSDFLPASRDGIPQLRPDYPETSHLMKMLRNVGAELPRWPHEDEPLMGMHQMRPTTSSSPSHIVQPINASKWERAAVPLSVGPVLQYPPRAGQVVPYGYQPVSNRYRDSNAGSPLISQSAADEGSRTGMKGSGILSSVNVSGAVAEPMLKSLSSKPEPSGASVSRQMTIFYGGQAHVFDDVHPNKAEVIMTLAGSNGGSWSTSFLPKPSRGETAKEARGSVAEEKSEEKQ